MTDFTFYTPENSDGERQQLLTDIKQKYGFVPNLFGYMAEAPYTIEAYVMLNELLAKTALTPAQQQICLLAVSKANKCEFCTVAHQAFSKVHQANQQTVEAILAEHDIENPEDKALVTMVVNMVNQRGWIDEGQLNAFFKAGFTRQHLYDLILIITIKTLSNYANHLTKPEANDELKAML